MEYVYAAMLLHAAEKEIDEKSVKAVLKGAGIDADDARVKALVASLAGVDIAEAMTQLLLLLQQPLLPLPPLAVPMPLLLKKQKRKRKKRKAASTVLARSLVEQGPIAADSHAG